MSINQKDSPEVVQFMTLFERLRDHRFGDAPERLAEAANNDAELQSLCFDLSLAADHMDRIGRLRRQLFAGPVDPVHVQAWRDYGERYAAVVSDIAWGDIFEKLDLPAPDEDKQTLPRHEREWFTADDAAEDDKRALKLVVGIAKDYVSNDSRDLPDEFVEAVLQGIDAFDQLTNNIELDIRGVLRRRILVPFTLIPRHVSNTYGGREKLSLLTNLQQAQEAFVFGAPYAALSLMRSVMEITLRVHYRAGDGVLSKVLKNVEGQLPAEVQPQRLWQVRNLANAILHLDRDEYEKLGGLSELKLEHEIVSLLRVLRSLIELAPSSQE